MNHSILKPQPRGNILNGYRSRMRCAEVCCRKGIPSGPQKGFPAERLIFLGKPSDAGNFFDFSTTASSGAGIVCGV